jgi:SAM-dependent methyltransferase
MAPDGLILDLGAGGRKIARHVIGVDFIPFKNTDVVANAHVLPFLDNSADGIFCTGVLEHLESPQRVLEEIRRVLKPSGIVHIEVPFIQPYHTDPYDYWRWTLQGLRLFAQAQGFTEISSGAHLGPTSAMNGLVIAYFKSWFDSRYARKLIEVIFSFFLFPFKFFDRWLINKTPLMSSGVFFVGKK